MPPKKVDLSERPKFGSMQKVFSDVESAPLDDPAFSASRVTVDESKNQDDTLKSAVHFMDRNRQMKDLMVQLEKNRDALESHRERLSSMADHIRNQALQALN